jgi:hypothetical protein
MNKYFSDIKAYCTLTATYSRLVKLKEEHLQFILLFGIVPPYSTVSEKDIGDIEAQPLEKKDIKE